MQKQGEILFRAKGLIKTYGKRKSAGAFTALKGLDFEIKRGEAVAIIGKSGSGKSTLMHLLALLDKPTKGKVLLGEEDTTKLRQKELNALRNQRFGFIFQSFFMNANDTVLNNVMLPLKIAGVKPKERRERALEALKAVELTDKANNKASDLSGGQKQRVCIARAIVNEPEVIFADEPTGNLDSATGMRITNILFSLHRNRNITLIVVTHDADLANKCHRQIRIADGKIVKDVLMPNHEHVPYHDYDVDGIADETERFVEVEE
ncbi:ABC transporter ATP-binding protein [Candidatus Saccharibacteria bacterium]|nr:ABC transporter ATP-binding protein [Candidatus Saccharibacteria bacterium]